jgi:hypothetical protein
MRTQLQERSAGGVGEPQRLAPSGTSGSMSEDSSRRCSGEWEQWGACLHSRWQQACAAAMRMAGASGSGRRMPCMGGWVCSWRRRRPHQFASPQLPSSPRRGHACTSGAQRTGCRISLIGCARGRLWPVRETRRSSLRKIGLQMGAASRVDGAISGAACGGRPATGAGRTEQSL